MKRFVFEKDTATHIRSQRQHSMGATVYGLAEACRWLNYWRGFNIKHKNTTNQGARKGAFFVPLQAHSKFNR